MTKDAPTRRWTWICAGAGLVATGGGAYMGWSGIQYMMWVVTYPEAAASVLGLVYDLMLYGGGLLLLGGVLLGVALGRARPVGRTAEEATGPADA